MFLLHMQSIPAKDTKYLRALRLFAAVTSFAGSLCVTILIARTLGPAQFGQYQFVQWFALLAVPFIGIGTSALSSRTLLSIPGYETPRIAAGIFRFLWHTHSYRSIIYLILCVLLVPALSQLPGTHLLFLPLLLATFAVPLVLLQRVVEMTLQSQSRIDLLILLHLIHLSILLLFVILIVLFLPIQLTTLLLAVVGSSFLALLIGYASIRRILPLHCVRQPDPLFKTELRQRVHVALWHTISDEIIWQPSALLLLQLLYWHTPTILAFYALSFLISSNLMRLIPVVLLNAVFPPLLRAFPVFCFTNTYEAFIKTSWLLAICGLPLLLCALLCSPLFVSSILGVGFLPLVLSLRIQLVAAYFGSVATLAVTHLSKQRHWTGQLRLGLGSAFLNIILVIPGTLLWGITGTALASSVAQSVAALGSLCICRHMLRVTARRDKQR